MDPTNSPGSSLNEKYSETTQTPAILIEGICLFIVLILFVFSLYFFGVFGNKLEEDRQITPLVKIPVILSLFFNLFGIICAMMISIIMETADWNEDNYVKALVFYICLAVSFSLGKVFLETFFLFRVYHSFKGSTYALSKHVLYECFVLIAVVSFLWCYTWLSSVSMVYISWIALSLEVSLMMIFLFVFVNRLSGLILMQKTDQQASIEMSSTAASGSLSPSVVSITDDSRKGSVVNDDDDATDIGGKSDSVKAVRSTFSDVQKRLMYLITRTIVLSSIALITTILFSLYAFFYVKFGDDDHLIFYILWTLEMTTNSICLFLSFNFSNDSYKRYVCYVLHYMYTCITYECTQILQMLSWISAGFNWTIDCKKNIER